MNKPYVKEYNETGELLNPITKDQPYLHRFRSTRGQSAKPYMIYTNPLTGEFVGKLRAKYSVDKKGNLVLEPVGNNRKNTSTRKGVQSRGKLR